MESAASDSKGSVQARTVGITAPGADRVVADKARDLLPALGTARPLGFGERELSRYL